MSRIYSILSKYFPKYNMFNVLEFIKDSPVQRLNYVNSKIIPLKLHNESMVGGYLENINAMIDDIKYLIQKDEYKDIINKNVLIIDLIKINAIPNSNGDFDKNDNCTIFIIDKKNKSGCVQSLANYTDYFECIRQANPYKVGDVLIRTIILTAQKNNIKKLNLTDDSYLLCNEVKITLIH